MMSRPTLAAGICDRFVHRTLDTEGWRREILADAPHVLIYPGLLMDTSSLQLAAQRLAPVQCNSWGHPETSGLPTLDYFLSSDLMEPPDAQAYYTEKLVRLPNLSIYYEPVASEPVSVTRAELGLRLGRPCSGARSRSINTCRSTMMSSSASRARPATASSCSCVISAAPISPGSCASGSTRAFAAAGLRADDYCVFLDRLSQSKFVAAAGLIGRLPGQHRLVGLQFGIGKSAA